MGLAIAPQFDTTPVVIMASNGMLADQPMHHAEPLVRTTHPNQARYRTRKGSSAFCLS